MTVSGTRPPAATLVPDRDDYRRAYEVVEAATHATHLRGLREATLDAIARSFGCRDLTFFVGETLEEAFQDPDPIVAGRATTMVDSYLGRYWRHDPFGRASVLPLYRRRTALRLCELPAPTGPQEARYVREFLTRHGIRDQLAIRLDAGAGGYALIGLLADRPGRFDVHDVLAAQLLSGPLSGVLRIHLSAARHEQPRGALSKREAEVAGLVAAGYSNRAIADALFITPDTVKKHVTKVLAAYGCRTRTQLAIAWHAAPG